MTAPPCLPPREVTPPKMPLPPKACDTHAHVFGPSDRFPYADDRSYTPPDAPLAKYLGMLDTVVRQPDRQRGVAVADAGVSRDELAKWYRLVWGGDWPHPRVEGEMPDAGHLLSLFQQWTPDQTVRHKILVSNPARLYGFPN